MKNLKWSICFTFGFKPLKFLISKLKQTTTTTATRTSPNKRFKDVRAIFFQHWFFFSETSTSVRWRVSYVKKCKKKWGSPTSFWREYTRKITPNLKKSDFLKNKVSVSGKPKNIAIKSLKRNVLRQTLYKWAYKGGGPPESRILAGYYVFNANISFTFQAINNLYAHFTYLWVIFRYIWR